MVTHGSRPNWMTFPWMGAAKARSTGTEWTEVIVAGFGYNPGDVEVRAGFGAGFSSFFLGKRGSGVPLL